MPVVNEYSYIVTGVHKMLNIRKRIIEIKVSWDTQYGTIITQKKVYVTRINWTQLSHSRGLTDNSQLFDKTDGIRYRLVIGRGLYQVIGLGIMNGSVYLIWNELQVPMVDMIYWNDTMIDNYQCHTAKGNCNYNYKHKTTNNQIIGNITTSERRISSTEQKMSTTSR